LKIIQLSWTRDVSSEWSLKQFPCVAGIIAIDMAPKEFE
jgi:hypothetical protein